MTQSLHLMMELPDSSGPTHPCTIAVNTEPFPTSVFKVLIWILATTTKICTTGRSRKVHTNPSVQPVRPPTRRCLTTLTVEYK